ncbi:MAG: hypothetical protein U0Z75_09750 [Deinococcaceae bacterium]
MHFQLDLKQNLLAKLVIDNAEDGPLVGIDALTSMPSTLSGNYGILYDILLKNSQRVVAALAARDEPYKGAISVTHLQTECIHLLPLPTSHLWQSNRRIPNPSHSVCARNGVKLAGPPDLLPPWEFARTFGTPNT